VSSNRFRPAEEEEEEEEEAEGINYRETCVSINMRARSLARSYEEINNAPFTPGKKSGRARWIGFMACRCCINGRTRARAILRARVRAAIRPIAITSREEKETPNNG